MVRRSLSTVVVAVALAALTACSSVPAEGPGAADRSGEPGASDPAPAAPTAAEDEATPSPSPTGPCADGTCKIEVAVGDVVTVPESYGLGPIEVTAITGDGVEMVAPLTGSGYSVSGCSGGGGVSSAGGGGVGLTCGEGPAATINDAMSLKVVDIRGAAAVLRVEPVG